MGPPSRDSKRSRASGSKSNEGPRPGVQVFMPMENEMVESKDVVNQSKDLISDLPKDITETILGCLHLQEAVKTSILSKKWRYKWTTIAELCFDLDFLLYINRNGSLKKIGLENIINSVFHLYSGQALTFTLWLPKMFCEDSVVDKWMLLLSKKGVKELTLSNVDPFRAPSDKHPMKLSSHLFSCKDLRVLHLRNFVLEPHPLISTALKNLIAINFYRVEIANDLFESIVYNASLLRILKVSHCKGVDHLNVHAPKLREMHLSGDYKTISLSNMPDLEVAFFAFSKLDNYSGHKISMECWPQLKKLDLRGDSLKVVAADMATKLLPIKFYQLKYLTLYNINFQAPSQFYDVVSLIKSSPNLQILELSFRSYEKWASEPITKFMEEQDWAGCSLDHLRTVAVDMSYIMYVSPELMLLKQLLRISPVLETMSFQHPSFAVDKFKAALEKFDRASPRAQVIHKPA